MIELQMYLHVCSSRVLKKSDGRPGSNSAYHSKKKNCNLRATKYCACFKKNPPEQEKKCQLAGPPSRAVQLDQLSCYNSWEALPIGVHVHYSCSMTSCAILFCLNTIVLNSSTLNDKLRCCPLLKIRWICYIQAPDNSV